MSAITKTLVTRSEWERRFPSAVRRRGERYWTSVEVPIEDEWVFFVNVRADEDRQIAARTMLVATFEGLLELLADLGSDAILAISGLDSISSDSGPVARVFQLEEIAVAEHSAAGWRKVFLCRMRDALQYTLDPADKATAAQLVNLVPVIKFVWAEAK